MLCEYGCGQEAKHQFKNGKWCCNTTISQCKAIKQRIGKKLKGRKIAEEVSIKRKRTCMKKYGVDNPSKNKQIIKKIKQTFIETYGVDNVSKLGAIKGKLRLSIKQINTKFPFFSKIEEMRYNPEKPIEEKEIQVHCKNHNCPNSKEQGGWFTPTKDQFKSRKDWLEKEGKDICYFYCSKICKSNCPLYKSKGSEEFQNIKNYTSEEYSQFRNFVLKRDDYICQYCGKKAEHVHHERPQKLEPFFALDPDFAWSVCPKCHYKYGHKDECSTGNLSSKICT